ncbi:carbon monoxide dehydrogenase subunit G [Aquincola sp. S2]|uniref:Carbon monoxide dehydrogenase subunit G n=1 Tax=Pseudaquabacterium terrae TaxID=2732868 RepID=A0ABX2ELT2_9BURK|nr:carbon monoxide dehydrogenase subunit G [Aquabacterium terrae]NRF69474.1 carbon monoxide dehydrogenase subunit G [Aquabacterium terrae]
MQLTNQQSLPVGQAQAWEALNDITLLQAAIPGCESITPTGPNQYEALVTAAIGPVKAKFKGKLQLENLQPPTSYTLRFEGQGGAAGHGKGSAEIRLEAVSARETILHYTANAQVGGKIAQIGSRLVDMAAQKMAADFFATFNLRLQERYQVAPEPAPAAAAQGGFARFVAWLRRLFGAA